MFYFYYLYVRMLYIPFGIFQMNQSTTSMGYLPLEWQPAMNRLSFTPYCFFFFLVFWSGFLFLFPFPSAFFNFYFYKKLYIYNLAILRTSIGQSSNIRCLSCRKIRNICNSLCAMQEYNRNR